jgi:hypothetical protein
MGFSTTMLHEVSVMMYDVVTSVSVMMYDVVTSVREHT